MPRVTGPIRRNFVARWSIWFELGVLRRSWRASSSRPRSRSSHWVRKPTGDGRPRGEGWRLTSAERDELARLRRENKQLRWSATSSRRAAAWFARETARSRPGLRVHERAPGMFPVAAMARVLGVSEAGFHAWRRRPVCSCRRRRRAAKTDPDDPCWITRGPMARRGCMPSSGQEASHGRKRIARLMRAAGLIGASRRRATIVTTRRDKEARPAPDLVDRDFTAFRPNQLWVADITYVPTASGFLYLAVVLDALEPQDRRLVDGQTICGPNWSWRPGDGDRPAAAGRRHPSQRPGQPT